MSQRSCENHAMKCRRVVALPSPLEYRGRKIYLCDDCAARAAGGKRLWLDDKYDAEDAAEELALETASEYGQAEARFDAWVRKNIWIQIEFEKLSDRARGNRKKFSAWAVCNVLRWNRVIEKPNAEDFKIPNGFIGFLARRYMERGPEDRGGFFEIRPMKGEDFELTKRRCGIT